jgi:ATP-dependent Clp protease ATP-binding subunit ClpA
MNNNNFSEQTKALINEARLVAVDLGHNHISTIHFFLGDCRLNHTYSIRGFVFRSEEEFNQFYKTQKNAEQTIFGPSTDDSLRLTIEAEQTLKKSLSEQKKYGHKKLEPFHIFLAASQLEHSLFVAILKPKEGLHSRLSAYYQKAGHIPAEIKKTGVFENIKNIFALYKNK